MPLHLGKQPAQPKPKDLQWSSLAASVQLPSVPARFGHANLFQDWWMLGNGPDDTVAPGFQGAGDCVWAGAAHEHRLINKLVHKVDVQFTGKDVISDYCGRDRLPARRSFDRQRHRRPPGARLPPQDRDPRRAGQAPQDRRLRRDRPEELGPPAAGGVHLRRVGIGFEFPNSAWDQFDNGRPWDVVANDGGNDGGHYVPIMGAPTADKVGVVTWGKRQEMTRAFYEKYNDESWVYITPEELNEKRRRAPRLRHGEAEPVPLRAEEVTTEREGFDGSRSHAGVGAERRPHDDELRRDRREARGRHRTRPRGS